MPHDDDEPDEHETNDSPSNFKELISRLPREIRVFPHGISAEVLEEFRLLVEDTDKSKPESEEFSALQHWLGNIDNWVDIDAFKRQLVRLSADASVSALRFIQQLAANPDLPKFQKEWLYAAEMQVQMRIENSLMDEPVGFIATGLGGLGKKIRYYFAVACPRAEHINSGKARLIQQDYAELARHYDIEIEQSENQEEYILFRVLVPFDRLVTDFVAEGIEQSDLLLDSEFWVTNVLHPQAADLQDWLQSKKTTSYE